MPVDDANRVKVTECQGELRQIKLDVILSEHDLLGEPGEQVTTAEKVENQIEFTLGLKIVRLQNVLPYLIFSHVPEMHIGAGR